MVQIAVILTGHHEREQPPSGFHHRRSYTAVKRVRVSPSNNSVCHRAHIFTCTPPLDGRNAQASVIQYQCQSHFESSYEQAGRRVIRGWSDWVQAGRDGNENRAGFSANQWKKKKNHIINLPSCIVTGRWAWWSYISYLRSYLSLWALASWALSQSKQVSNRAAGRWLVGWVRYGAVRRPSCPGGGRMTMWQLQNQINLPEPLGPEWWEMGEHGDTVWKSRWGRRGGPGTDPGGTGFLGLI